MKNAVNCACSKPYKQQGEEQASFASSGEGKDRKRKLGKLLQPSWSNFNEVTVHGWREYHLQQIE
jgi:hypothetical protein